MTYYVEIEAPANGRSRQATVIVRDAADGKIAVSDKGDLTAIREREKLAKRVAKQLELDADKVLQLLETAWTQALQANLDAPPPPRPPISDAPKLTDQGNGQRLVTNHGASFRHCYPWHKDLVFAGRNWGVDRTGQVERWAKDTVRQLYVDAMNESDDDKRQKLIAHALHSEDAKRIHNMMSLARSEPGIPILPEHLDLDPMLLNVLNGTVDLRTGTLRKHRPADYLTKLCPVEYRPDAACPTWEKFLEEIFPKLAVAVGEQGPEPDAELIRFVQRVLGYCLTGDVREQILLIFWGSGSNGKSTLLNVLLELLGCGYAMLAASELLLAKKNSHPTEKADLFGQRLVVAIETEDSARLAEGTVKALTGSDRIRARRMREDFWEFAPTHKLILCTNHKPEIRGTDHAIWRRPRLVPFTVTIPDDKQDKQLPQKLRAEFPGILAWLVRGCLEWQQHGLGLPEAVKVATAEYRSEQDTVAGFLADCCDLKLGDKDYRCRASALYARFVAWGESTGSFKGSKVPSQRNLGEALKARDLESYTSNGTWYTGIRLRQEAEEDITE